MWLKNIYNYEGNNLTYNAYHINHRYILKGGFNNKSKKKKLMPSCTGEFSSQW